MKDKQRKKSNFKISKGTIYTILILVAIFALLNFVVFPIMFRTATIHNEAQLPIIKRGNIPFVDSEVERRYLEVPPLVAPADKLGKQNPFE